MHMYVYIYYIYMYIYVCIMYVSMFMYMYVCIYSSFPKIASETSVRECRLDRIAAIHQPSNIQFLVLKSKLHHNILRTNIVWKTSERP